MNKQWKERFKHGVDSVKSLNEKEFCEMCKKIDYLNIVQRKDKVMYYLCNKCLKEILKERSK